MSLLKIDALERLAPRERLLVGIAAALLAFFVTWQFIVSPILAASSTAQRQLDAAKRDHMIVSAGLPTIALQNGGTSKQAFDRDKVIETARRANVTISRMQPGSGASVQIWLEDSPAPNIYSFLSDLDARYGVSTTKAQMTRRDGGSVATQFTFAPR